MIEIRCCAPSACCHGALARAPCQPIAYSPSPLPFFLQYAALVLLGAAHGLILLPVLLAAFGPEELEVGGWGAAGATSGKSTAALVRKQPELPV